MMLFTVTLKNKFYSPPSKNGLKLVCNVNIVYRNLKSENSQDYAKKSQRNCKFMSSASGLSDPGRRKGRSSTVFSNNNIFYIEFVDCVDEVLSAKYKNVVLGRQKEVVCDN